MLGAVPQDSAIPSCTHGPCTLRPRGLRSLWGCRGFANHPREVERGWGNALHTLSWEHRGPKRTGRGHQPSGAATGASAWGPLHPPATRSPPWGLSPASLTYFGPAGDKGGLCSSAQAEEGWGGVGGAWGEHDQPGAYGTLTSVALRPFFRIPGGTPRVQMPEKLWGVPNTQPALTSPSHPAHRSGSTQRRGYRGPAWDTSPPPPPQTPPGVVQDPPAPAEAARGRFHRPPMARPKVIPESSRGWPRMNPRTPPGPALDTPCELPRLSRDTPAPPEGWRGATFPARPGAGPVLRSHSGHYGRSAPPRQFRGASLLGAVRRERSRGGGRAHGHGPRGGGQCGAAGSIGTSGAGVL